MRATISKASANRSSARSRRTIGPVLLAGSTALTMLLFPVIHRPALRLVWNVSASVPVGLYRIVPNLPLREGELVAVRPSPAVARFMASRRYVEANALLVKPVAATAGRRVCRANATVTINGRAVVTALGFDSRNRPMPVWRGCHRLGTTELLLLARGNAASFDGRYFGVTAMRQVVGRAVPMWTW